jgi:hypothetical protein
MTSRTTFANDPVAKALVQLGQSAIGPSFQPTATVRLPEAHRIPKMGIPRK